MNFILLDFFFFANCSRNHCCNELINMSTKITKFRAVLIPSGLESLEISVIFFSQVEKLLSENLQDKKEPYCPLKNHEKGNGHGARISAAQPFLVSTAHGKLRKEASFLPDSKVPSLHHAPAPPLMFCHHGPLEM